VDALDALAGVISVLRRRRWDQGRRPRRPQRGLRRRRSSPQTAAGVSAQISYHCIISTRSHEHRERRPAGVIRQSAPLSCAQQAVASTAAKPATYAVAPPRGRPASPTIPRGSRRECCGRATSLLLLADRTDEAELRGCRKPISGDGPQRHEAGRRGQPTRRRASPLAGLAPETDAGPAVNLHVTPIAGHERDQRRSLRGSRTSRRRHRESRRRRDTIKRVFLARRRPAEHEQQQPVSHPDDAIAQRPPLHRPVRSLPRALRSARSAQDSI